MMSVDHLLPHNWKTVQEHITNYPWLLSQLYFQASTKFKSYLSETGIWGGGYLLVDILLNILMSNI